ncbi:metallophosphoesterase family protein [Bhargavaea ullalensis]|uniref:Phosphodiesterase n=1 Tax=Bhargavaea ullalensis TaxID=1265685 RepID=A0ABV2GA83_9BACL
MKFAIIGDIHSSVQDLEDVLDHISQHAPGAEVVGTGDLFECTISKKRAPYERFSRLEEVMLLPEGLLNLLDFPSVMGNQEERIAMITESGEPLLRRIRSMPETMDIDGAEIVHGHQWEWGGDPWTPVYPGNAGDLTFYGHSHESDLSIDGEPIDIGFGVPYDVTKGQTFVNVGPVVGDREWVLYDPAARTVEFRKVME